MDNSKRSEYFLNLTQIKSIIHHKVNYEKAYKYAKDMENGDQFPPVKIFFDQKELRWKCKDGAHRTMAAKLAGKPLWVRSHKIMGNKDKV